jgi:acyl-ACP thioesterase
MYVIGLRIAQAIQISMYQQISTNAQCVAPAAAKHTEWIVIKWTSARTTCTSLCEKLHHTLKQILARCYFFN